MMHQPALPDPQKGEKLTKNVTKMGWQCCFSRGITDESAQSSTYIGLSLVPNTNLTIRSALVPLYIRLNLIILFCKPGGLDT